MITNEIKLNKLPTFCCKNVIGYNKLIDLFCTVLIYSSIGFMGMKGISSLNPTNISLNISYPINYVWINSNYRPSFLASLSSSTSKNFYKWLPCSSQHFLSLMVRQKTVVHWGALTHIDENFRKIDGWDLKLVLKSFIYLLSSYFL